ncbi:WxcM-like domain-containing protein [Campylobacter lari]|uniref:sugar 3,4-ketoisomerase n=1 Tax=Campylobacter lari TaxID=201 RepID=UPI001277E1FD|nr:FdtA/QdtA family cupin domain-containing protein [Campylobacter lari]MBT0741462.1 FdtA/QdtA family cupin domain-containing protein [Campylobacter lari]MCR6530192.1 FdtA/QdtA family cupin domain-containing protein [Campylobacter lari]MCR6537691.1 FdtA/QdtA family cupin domain-containing protein [Campylobacter lari]MCR6539522.1 FdtA/QdtA family cupin domain-containing protein [Campylobacter lari]
MKNIKILNFEEHITESGSLIALQESDEIPFKIKRIYYIYNLDQNAIRGKHAHKDLEQICVCVSGQCSFYLSNGKEEFRVKLNSPSKGLYIGNMIWREFTDFSKDCVLMVIASKKYNPKDYIVNFEDMTKYQ